MEVWLCFPTSLIPATTALYIFNGVIGVIRDCNFTFNSGGIAIDGQQSSIDLHNVNIINNTRLGIVCEEGELTSTSNSYRIFDNFDALGQPGDIECGDCKQCLCAPVPGFDISTNNGTGVGDYELHTWLTAAFRTDLHSMYWQPCSSLQLSELHPFST